MTTTPPSGKKRKRGSYKIYDGEQRSKMAKYAVENLLCFVIYQMMFQYFVKIVPTTYVKTSGKILYTNQYSVTKHSKAVGGSTGETGLPGMFVMYELSPMMVKYTEKHRSFMHFLTGVCAIIGGIFTVAGLIDSMVYHSAKAIQKKIDLGKAT